MHIAVATKIQGSRPLLSQFAARPDSPTEENRPPADSVELNGAAGASRPSRAHDGSTGQSTAMLQHFQALTNNLATQAGMELSGLAVGGLMFHGSAIPFDSVQAMPNTRISRGKDGKDSIDWQGTAIFAAMDPRVALHYTARRGSGISAGIDLRNFTHADQPITYGIYGGDSLEQAMSLLYGDPDRPESCEGYVHLLDRSKFVHEPGLGTMEMVTRDESANLGRLTINRRAAIDELVKAGSVRLQWSRG